MTGDWPTGSIEPPGLKAGSPKAHDPALGQHEEMLEWMGGDYDPEAFLVDEVNQRIARLSGAGSKAEKEAYIGSIPLDRRPASFPSIASR